MSEEIRGSVGSVEGMPQLQREEELLYKRIPRRTRNVGGEEEREVNDMEERTLELYFVAMFSK